MAGLLASPALRQSRGVLLTTFVNKLGSIGLSLVAILLVERGVSTAEGTVVLSALKATMLGGTVLGGVLADRCSPRSLVLAALLMSAAGLGFLPFQAALPLILLFGMLAQFSEALTNVAQRLLLMEQVDRERHKESLGWMRMTNNLAQIFSFSIGALGAGWGLKPLMLFDAASSLGALAVGWRILPSRPPSREAREEEAAGGAPRGAFFLYALVLMGWSFSYELFLEGAAGRLEMLHPGGGLRRFSVMMILNTVLCAAFAVQATRLFRRAWPALSWGMVLTAAGLLAVGWGAGSQAWVLGGAFLITLGELMIGAVAQYVLLRLTPAGSASGFHYSLGLTLMQGGRIAGASCAFPLLIHAARPASLGVAVGGVLAVQLAVLRLLRPEIESRA